MLRRDQCVRDLLGGISGRDHKREEQEETRGTIYSYYMWDTHETENKAGKEDMMNGRR